MATIASLAAAINTNSGTKSASGTPTANDLIVILTFHTGNNSAATPTDDNADGLGAYIEVAACACVKASSADQGRMFIRSALIGSATSTTFSHAPGASTGGGIKIFRVAGMTRTGASAAKQGSKQDNQSAGTPAVAMGAAVQTGNVVIGLIFNATNPAAMTAPSGWTEDSDTGYNTPTTGIEVAVRASGETGSTITWGSSSASAFCSSVLELDTTAAIITRTATDAPTTSESAARTLAGVRATTEAPTSSDVATRALDGVRATTEAPATAENATRLFTVARTAADAISSAEAVARLLAGFRTAADAASATDASGQTVLTITRGMSDNLVTSEAASRHADLVRNCSGGTTYFVALTIDHNKVPSTQTDFPVLVSITDPSLKSVSNGGHVHRTDGFDLGFYSNLTGTKLKWEIESYDPVNGVVVAWVKIASLSSSTDTIFYMYYGDTTITTDQSDPVNVWTNSFLAVMHYKDGTTLSTVNSVTGTTMFTNSAPNPATAGAGKIDGGAILASASEEGFATPATGPAAAAMTLSAWVKATSFPNALNYVHERGFSAIDDYALAVKSNGKLYGQFITATGQTVTFNGTGTHTLSTGVWYYLVLTYDSVNGLIAYVDGAVDQTVAPNGAAYAGAIASSIGYNRGVGSGTFWNGALDEVRFDSAARSADWITAQYNNQSDPSTFMSVSSEALLGSGDALVLADAATKAINRGRATTDALTIAEAVARLISPHVTATDHPIVSESVIRGKAVQRTVVDAINTADAAARVLVLLRTATDALAISESAVVAFGTVATANETPHTSEVAGRLLQAVRSCSDNAILSESVDRIYSILRSSSDSLVVSDSATRAIDFVRELADNPIISEAANRLLTLLRATTEAAQTAETATAFRAVTRTTTDLCVIAQTATAHRHGPEFEYYLPLNTGNYPTESALAGDVAGSSFDYVLP